MSDERRPHRDEQVLRDMYCRAGLTTGEIADYLGVSATTVRKYMERHGIERRPNHAASDEQVLRDMYERAGLTMAEIGDYLDLAPSTVYKWVKHHGIETRSQGRQARGPVTDEQVLRNLYWKAKLNTVEIAEYYDVSPKTVLKYMKKHGIDIRAPGNWNGFVTHHSYEGRDALDFDGDPPHTCPECGNEYETRTAQHECTRAHSRERADELSESDVF